MAIVRALVVITAVWAVLGVVAALVGLFPTAEEESDSAAQAESAADEVVDARAPAVPQIGASAVQRQSAAAPRGVPPVPQAYRSCADPENSVVVVAQVFGGPAPEVLYGCGDSFDVLALRRGAFEFDRVAHIDGRTDEPGTRVFAAHPVIADITNDGLPDLSLPFHHRASPEGPLVGGQLVLVPRLDSGALGEALPLGHVAIRAMSAGRIDGTRGPDLVFAHSPEGRTPELWVMSGGAAPGRVALLPLDGRTLAVAVGDVNADDHNDLCVVRTGADLSEVQVTYGDGASGFGRTVGTRVPGATAGLIADLDGDAKTELLVAGESLVVVRAVAGATALTLEAIAPLNLTELQVADVDADGRVDILGINAGRAVWLHQVAAQRFEERPFLAVEGGTLTRWALGDLDENGSLDVVALVTDGESRSQLLVVPDPLRRASVKVAAAPRPVVDAALSVVIHAY